MICETCGYVNDPDAVFCVECSQPLLKICPDCGTENKPVAKFCKKCGQSFQGQGEVDTFGHLERPHDIAPDSLQKRMNSTRHESHGQRKHVTILFADVVGSTSIAEKLDPEEWKEVVQGAHNRIMEAVFRYEGTIAQLLGDGVLAFFGAPSIHEDDPERSVRAALDCQASIADYRRQLEGVVDDFQIRIGINVGEVVIGELGSEKHAEYLAVGDAVNVAARLQNVASPGGVLISEACARQVEYAFEIHEIGEIKLKGKSDAVHAFEVLGMLAQPSRARGLGGERTPYIGRESEIIQLQDTVMALCRGDGGIVAITGEAGIGKTRLLEEVRDRIREVDGPSEPGTFPPSTIRWIEGRALSYGSTLSNWVIVQLLLSDLGLSDGAPELKIKVGLRKRTEELLGDDAAEVYPYLAHLLEVELEEEEAIKIQQLGGETLRHQTKIELGRYFEAIAKGAPTVLIVEDTQWADPTSLETIGELLWLTEWVPLLMVFLTREERDHPSWGLLNQAEKDYPQHFLAINLDRFDPDHSRLLAEKMIHTTDLPKPLLEQINSRAEGNPFYVEEVVKHLLESGLIREKDGAWLVTDRLEESGIPETLQGVLLARIDRLEEGVRDTLQLASVIGKSFLYKVLAAISQAEHELHRHLTDLQRIDLVREKARLPDLEYVFKHSLTQEATYNSILLKRRREFHLRVAHCLIELFPDRQDEMLGVIAHHYGMGGDTEQAIGYLIRYGDKLRIADAHEEAVEVYHRVLPLLDVESEHEKARQIWLKIGLIHHLNSHFEVSRIAYENAQKLAKRVRGSHLEAIPHQLRRMKIPSTPRLFEILDPGKVDMGWGYVSQLFHGLVNIGLDMNIEPCVAESWEISADGRRYIFHIREDVTWTDGHEVTAQDFAWAWTRNLSLGSASPYIILMDDVIGARDFRLGVEHDPGTVGIKVLDPFTLEVNLTHPAPYFLYVVAFSPALPLPRHIIEKYGDGWWRPETIVCNGPFKLVEYDDAYVRFGRNESYFGSFPGNLDEVIYPLYDDSSMDGFRRILTRDYQAGEIDFLNSEYWVGPENFPPQEFLEYEYIASWFLVLNSLHSPLDHRLLRKAIAHSIDLSESIHPMISRDQATGGLVHPAYPGYSAGIAYRPNVELDRTSLEEFSQDTPVEEMELTYYIPFWEDVMADLMSSVEERLGISLKQVDHPNDKSNPVHIEIHGWGADYPDPDTFLRNSSLNRTLDTIGYRNVRMEELISRAKNTLDRKKRLALYRQLDEFFVKEEILAIPLWYESKESALLKPHIKKFDPRFTRLENVIIEDPDQ